MPKLRLELFRYGSLVFGKVLEQAEELRAKTDGAHLIGTQDDFRIISSSTPYINIGTLAIRGHDESGDSEIFFFDFVLDAKAIAFCSAIKIMVDRINGEPESNSSVVKVM